VVGKILDRLGIAHRTGRRWQGLDEPDSDAGASAPAASSSNAAGAPEPLRNATPGGEQARAAGSQSEPTRFAQAKADAQRAAHGLRGQTHADELRDLLAGD